MIETRRVEGGGGGGATVRAAAAATDGAGDEARADSDDADRAGAATGAGAAVIEGTQPRGDDDRSTRSQRRDGQDQVQDQEPREVVWLAV